MNRKFSAEFSRLANLLTEADPLATRAARAMVPDGLQKSVASKNMGNVITLHDDCAKRTRSGRAQCNEESNAFAFPQPPVGSLAEAVEARHEQ